MLNWFDKRLVSYNHDVGLATTSGRNPGPPDLEIEQQEETIRRRKELIANVKIAAYYIKPEFYANLKLIAQNYESLIQRVHVRAPEMAFMLMIVGSVPSKSNPQERPHGFCGIDGATFKSPADDQDRKRMQFSS